VARVMRALLAALVVALALVAPAQGAYVRYVVDGDTVRLRSGTYVRLIGVNAPERGRCGYVSATRTLDRLVNGYVRLVRPRGYDNADRYGRLLRYVHDAGRDTGRAVIYRGWARNYDAYPHPRRAGYERAEASARRANRGGWRRCW
jgi:endonuclease YncB( thermonuclease family)